MTPSGCGSKGDASKPRTSFTMSATSPSSSSATPQNLTTSSGPRGVKLQQQLSPLLVSFSAGAEAGSLPRSETPAVPETHYALYSALAKAVCLYGSSCPSSTQGMSSRSSFSRSPRLSCDTAWAGIDMLRREIAQLFPYHGVVQTPEVLASLRATHHLIDSGMSSATNPPPRNATVACVANLQDTTPMKVSCTSTSLSCSSSLSSFPCSPSRRPAEPIFKRRPDRTKENSSTATTTVGLPTITVPDSAPSLTAVGTGPSKLSSPALPLSEAELSASSALVSRSQLPEVEKSLQQLLQDFENTIVQCQRVARDGRSGKESMAEPQSFVNESRDSAVGSFRTTPSLRREFKTISQDDLPSAAHRWRHHTVITSAENGNADSGISPYTLQDSSDDEERRLEDVRKTIGEDSIDGADLMYGIVAVASAVGDHLFNALFPAMSAEPTSPTRGTVGSELMSSFTTAAAPRWRRSASTKDLLAECVDRHPHPRSPPSSNPEKKDEEAECRSVVESIGASEVTGLLRKSVEDYIWRRVTALLTILSSSRPQSGSQSGADTEQAQGETVLEMEERYFLQLQMWLWLYGASGLASHATLEYQASVRCSRVDVDGDMSRQPSSTRENGVTHMTRLLQVADCLARLLQQRQYQSNKPATDVGPRPPGSTESGLDSTTFLAFSGVRMVGKAMYERLLPLQNIASAGDSMTLAGALATSSMSAVADSSDAEETGTAPPFFPSERLTSSGDPGTSGLGTLDHASWTSTAAWNSPSRQVLGTDTLTDAAEGPAGTGSAVEKVLEIVRGPSVGDLASRSTPQLHAADQMTSDTVNTEYSSTNTTVAPEMLSGRTRDGSASSAKPPPTLGVDLTSILLSADLPPSLGRLEQEVHRARQSVQFARKLGTLYATQDMNALLPLLPSVIRVAADADEGDDSGVVGAEKSSIPINSSHRQIGVDSSSIRAPILGSTGSFAAARPTRYQLSPHHGAASFHGVHGLPPMGITPRPMSGRRSVTANWSARRPAAPPPPPHGVSLSAHRDLLMEQMSVRWDTMQLPKNRFLAGSSCGIEMSLSLALGFLLQMMGGILEELAETERDAGNETGSASAFSTPLRTQGQSSEVPANTLPARQAQCPQTPNFIDELHSWKVCSAYTRDTLSCVVMTALQRKESAMAHELLEYISMDLAMEHYYSFQYRGMPSTTPGAVVRRSESSKEITSPTTPTTKSQPLLTRLVDVPRRSEDSMKFIYVWLGSFAKDADTTKHLLLGDHSTPISLQRAVWSLAGLAQYLILTRARGYNLYGAVSALSATTPHGSNGASSPTMVDGLHHPTASYLPSRASAGLQAYISSQLVEPMEQIFGIIVSFMASIAGALSSESGGVTVMDRLQLDGVLITEGLSDDDEVLHCPGDTMDYQGNTDSPGGCGSEAGAGAAPGSMSERADGGGEPTCWMELAVHYFLEIVDVLLDVSLHLPEKPLFLYHLTVWGSRAHLSVETDEFSTVSLSNSALVNTVNFVMPSSANNSSSLDQLQQFLSSYTSAILQTAVNAFSLENSGTATHLAANSPSGTDDKPFTTSLAALLLSMATSFTSSFSEFANSSTKLPGRLSSPLPLGQQGVATWSPLSSAPSSSLGSISKSTMWWPKACFQRYQHLLRILEHAQLLSIFLNRGSGSEDVTAPILAELARQTPYAPGMQASGVTALLDTSDGPCAQLLSIPFARPVVTLDATVNNFSISSVPSTAKERYAQVTTTPSECHFRGGHRSAFVDRAIREACGGLWMRIQVLQLLCSAAAPLDRPTFARFIRESRKMVHRLRDGPTAAHYSTITSLVVENETVLPAVYTSTYVRLLFLRYVQAFYADLQTYTGMPAGPDLSGVDGLELTLNGLGSISQSCTAPIPDDASSLGTPSARVSTHSPRIHSSGPFSTTLRSLSQQLWVQYCHHLLWVLRELCWNSRDAHQTATNLSIASVFGRLLQMASDKGGSAEEMETDELLTQSLAPNAVAFNLDADGGQPLELLGATGMHLSMDGFTDFELSSNSASTLSSSDEEEWQGASVSPLITTEVPSNLNALCKTGKGVQQLSGETGASPRIKSHILEVSANLNELKPISEIPERPTLPPTVEPATTAVVQSLPTLPVLNFTGLPTALYFASSGDTAAAKEDQYFLQQSKQTEPIHDVASAKGGEAITDSVAQVSPTTADAPSMLPDRGVPGEDDVDFMSPNSFADTGHSFLNVSAGMRDAFPTPSVDLSTPSRESGGPSAAGRQHQPVTLPKLPLQFLGPPLYFISSGDTGIFAETAPAPVPARRLSLPSCDEEGAPLTHATELPTQVSSLHVDPALNTSAVAVPAVAAGTNTSAQSVSPAPNAAPAFPLGPTRDVVLPKLSFRLLGPPMYFTSSGDTGGFVEAHEQRVEAAASSSSTVAGTAAPEVPATVAVPLIKMMPVESFSASLGNASLPHFTMSVGTPLNGSILTSAKGERDRAVLSGAVPTFHGMDDPPHLGQLPKSHNGATGAASAIAPAMPPVVTVELILCLCSMVLQRDSGMIQYTYTVSSLTQRRAVAGPVGHQRRWLREEAGRAAPALYPRGGRLSDMDSGTTSAGGLHWQTTPQHSPSSFHVIRALHTYLQDRHHRIVVEQLEEWLWDTYGTSQLERLERAVAAATAQAVNDDLSVDKEAKHHLQFPDLLMDDELTPYASGRLALLRLLLPRRRWMTRFSYGKRIGAGGYGSVMSATYRFSDSNACVAGDGRLSTRSTVSDVQGGASDATQRWLRVEDDLIRLLHGSVAVKRMPLKAQGSESGNLPVSHGEVLAMYRLRHHPHIANLLAFGCSGEEYILVMPQYSGGSLRVWRQKQYPLGCAVLTQQLAGFSLSQSGSSSTQPLRSPSKQVPLLPLCASLLLQVLEAVEYMHARNIRHGDIKADNVLIASSYNAPAAGGADSSSAQQRSSSTESYASSVSKTDENIHIVPTVLRLCDFGSCDTCTDDDIAALRNDVMAGEARFMTGRWGVGRGTEAIQPPELISCKRRYHIFKRILATGSTAASSPPGVSLRGLEPVDRPAGNAMGESILLRSTRFTAGGPPAATTVVEDREVMRLLRRAELAVDMWACGCLLYEMLTGRMLFGEARLGRLMVLASSTDDVVSRGTGAHHQRRSDAGLAPRGSGDTASSSTTALAPSTLPQSSFTRHTVLDEWERRDLESAAGPSIVSFLSRLLDMDPLQRPTAAEALYAWRSIMEVMGL